MKTKLCFVSCLLFLTVYCFAQNKAKGHFWDLNGIKHEGKVKLVFASMTGWGTMINFYQKGQKTKLLDRTIMQSFVWETDSFTQITDFSSSPAISNKSDFVKVVSTGKINLYRHWFKKGTYVTSSRYLTSTYVVQLEYQGKYIGIYSKARFEQYILPAIKEDKMLYNKVLGMRQKDWLVNIVDIIEEYNKEDY